jgi:ATP-dependent RNA helicase RhlE
MTPAVPTFEDLGVSDAVIEALAARGITSPFPIQIMVIQDATQGHDTLARSKTGSGKTLGFAIPIVEQLDPEAKKRPEALVLVPTRELATQVKDDFSYIAKAKHLKVKAVYGGTNVKEQAKGADTAHILIATPGRLDDLVERRLVKLGGVRIFVLDEADRMLDMGFQPQVDRIVRHLPKDRQTMFFSATLDGAVGRIADVYTRNAVRHEIESDTQTVDEANHRFVPVEAHDKLTKLIELAHGEESEGLTLVFVNTKRHVESLARQLRNQGVPTVTMHGDMTQQARERALQRFEDKHVGVLVATDVAARGLDLDDISLVVNYDPPQDDKGYVHRVGRTARAGRSGTSITFVTPEQLGDVSRMAARLDLHAEFELEGMKVAPPRTVFSGSGTARGRRSGLTKPRRRR